MFYLGLLGFCTNSSSSEAEILTNNGLCHQPVFVAPAEIHFQVDFVYILRSGKEECANVSLEYVREYFL